MLARSALRSTRALRTTTPAVRAPIRRNVRFQSSNTSSSSSSSGGAGGLSHTTTAALIGVGASTAVFYGWYKLSGLSTAVGTAKQAKSYIDSSTNQLKSSFKDATPDNPSEIIQALKETANKYARWLPGGREYVDKAFDDVEKIRSQHGGEVDNIVREAYGELRDASKKGMNVDMLGDVWEILQKHLGRLSSLAANASQAILDNHPQLKQQFGGSFDQLKQLGDKAGPQAQKMVDETWGEVSKILSGGFKLDTFDRIRKLVEEKIQQVQQMGDEAWQKGYEQLKPMLGKNEKVKELVEKNLDVLKQGNVGEAVQKVQSAVQSGSMQDLEGYIEQAKKQAQNFASSSSTDLSKWLDMVPNGSKILSGLQKYKDVAEKHGHEAEQLAKDTLHDLLQVLDKRSDQLEQVAGKAKGEAEKK
ncbi:hypothetical protein B0A50_01311 [Salinomyces thailandicus]|uniref:Uncharacterized protein n=1 Tax=Salinomyces thailandicus TaxID=706561 RepID=A0A4U0UA51_9PEZI|nr:hypothetical protein B0A50_01311 [Salinomyces thailandica]